MKKLVAILILCLVLALSSEGSIGSAHSGRTYPVMHPDQETLEKWIEDYNTAPLAQVEIKSWEAASPGGSQDLLGHHVTLSLLLTLAQRPIRGRPCCYPGTE